MGDIGSSTIDISSDEDDEEEDKAMEQINMILTMTSEDRLEKAFQQFDNDNPEVYRLFKRFTFDALNAGFTNYGACSVIERIRWHTNVETRGESFKINNNHYPYYARKFMDEFPNHKDFFRTRVTNKERRERVA